MHHPFTSFASFEPGMRLYSYDGNAREGPPVTMALVTQAETVPEISVIIASYNASATIERCLGALTTMVTAVPFEVVVVDSSQDRTAELIASRFPEVTLLKVATRLYPGDARNLGVERARADILAFTDADCIVNPRWIEEISEAHRTSGLVAGGSVDNGNPESMISWANYFCEFTAWMPTGPARPLPEIPTACLSVKRRAFEDFGPFIGGTLCSDSEFCWRLARAGSPPVFVPSMRVAHLSVTQPSVYLVRKWRHGRAFARVRASEHGFGRTRCLLNLLGAPLVPCLLLYRTARAVARARFLRREFIMSAPLVFLGRLVWALGEAVTYSRLALDVPGAHFRRELREHSRPS
jgi:GT2 family glycosyltransferase